MAIPILNTCNSHISTFPTRKGSVAAVSLWAALLVSLALLASAAIVGVAGDRSVSLVASGGSGGSVVAGSLAGSAVVVGATETEPQEPEPAPAPTHSPPASAPPVPARSAPAASPPVAAAGSSSVVSGPGFDGPVVVLGQSVVVAEGETLSVPVSLEGGTIDEGVVVSYVVDVSSGSAGAADFVRADLSGSVTVAAGESEAMLSVRTFGDGVVERDETFAVRLTGATSLGGFGKAGNADVAVLAEGEVFGVIRDDDGVVLGVSIGDASVAEGSADAGGQLSFPVSLVGGTIDQELALAYEISHGTTDAGDFVGFASSGTVRIPANQASADLVISVAGDATAEVHETFEVSLPGEHRLALSGGGSASGVLVRAIDGVATGTIRNDDGISLAVEVTGGEAAEGGQVEFTVTLVGDTDAPGRGRVIGNAQIRHISTDAADFVTTRLPRWVIAAGETSTTVRVPTAANAGLERAEEFELLLENPYHLGRPVVPVDASQAVAVGTILSDYTQELTVKVADARATEGGNLVFAAVLEGGSVDEAIVVDYVAVARGGAGEAGRSDLASSYSRSGVLTFGASATTGSVMLGTADDSLAEGSETLTLSLLSVRALTGSDNASVRVDIAAASQSVTGTILDNDSVTLAASLNLAENPQDVREGGQLGLGVTLVGGPADQNIEVGYVIGNITTTGSDFTGGLTGSFTIDAGQASASLPVSTEADTVLEPVEFFQVELDQASYAGSGTAVATSGMVTGAVIPTDQDQPVLTIADVSATEPSALEFSVGLSKTVGYPVKVRYETADTAPAGSDRPVATGDEDYTPASGVLKFPASSTPSSSPAAARSFTVTVTDDDHPEPDESFQARLTYPLGARLADPAYAWGTITDAGAEPVITLAVSANSPVVVPENSGTLSYTVSIVGGSDADHNLTIGYEIDPGSHAVAEGVDYYLAQPNGARDSVLDNAGSVTIAEGSSSATIVVTPIDDALPEPTRAFTLRLVWALNAVLADNSSSSAATEAAGAITDDDLPVFVTLSAGQAAEGQGLPFTLELSRPIAQDIPITYDATPDPGVAYALGGGTVTSDATRGATVTIPAGAVRKTFKVFIADDDLDEAAVKSLVVALTSAGQHVSLGAVTTAAGSVLDNDEPSLVTISDARADAGMPAEFKVTLTRPLSQPLTVTYATADGTGDAAATEADGDYTPAASDASIPIPAGETSAAISVDTAANTSGETDETFAVTLTGVTAGGDGRHTPAQLGAAVAAVATIVDTSGLPRVEVAFDAAPPGQTSIGEGQTFTARITLSDPAAQEVRVSYRIADGSATAPADYTLPQGGSTGTAVFTGTETEQTVEIRTQTDRLDEPNETFTVELGELDSAYSAFAKLGAETKAEATIADLNDTQVTIGAAAATEADGYIAFPITLTRALAQPVTLTYTASHGSQPGVSYSAVIPANLQNAVVLVPVADDGEIEAGETVTVELTGVELTGGSGTQIRLGSASTATGTITDDDTPEVTISDARVREGQPAVFTVSLSKLASTPITASYTTSDAASPDYTAVPASASATASFAPGSHTTTISVDTTDDTIPQSDQTFQVSLRSITNGTAVLGQPAHGTGTIVDDDTASLPLVTLSGGQAAEGSPITFTAAIPDPATQDITITYQTRTDHGGASASDFTSVTAGTVTIDATKTSGTFTIATSQDALAEPDETFEALLTQVTSANAKLGHPIVATGTIVDTPTITVSENNRATEGEPVSFTITLSEIPAQTITLNYHTQDNNNNPGEGDAQAGSDYRAIPASQPQQITFTAGTDNLTRTIDIQTIANNDVVGDETFQLNLALASPTSAVQLPDPAHAIGTIQDRLTLTLTPITTAEDGTTLPGITIDDQQQVTVTEGTSITYEATLNNSPAQTTTFTYHTSDTTTTAGEDYTPIPQPPNTQRPTITFTPDATDLTREITIATHADNDITDDETLTLTLTPTTPTTNTQIPPTITTTLTIKDRPTLTITNGQAAEGNKITFQASLTRPLDQDLEINYHTSDGTATASADYTAITEAQDKKITFASGTTELVKTIEVATIANSDQPTANETFNLNLTSTADIQLPGPATGTIFDMPTLTVTSNPVTMQGDPAKFTIQLSQALTAPISVTYATWRSPGVGATNQAYNKVTLPLAAGTRSQDVDVIPDTSSVPLNETYHIALIDATPATDVQLGASTTAATTIISTATSTITNTGTPTLTVHDAAPVTEGETITFYATLSHAISQPVTVNYRTHSARRDYPNNYAKVIRTTNEIDYRRVLSGSLTFQPGITSLPITIQTFANNDDDSYTEVFYLALYGQSSNAQLSNHRPNFNPVNAPTGRDTIALGTIISRARLTFTTSGIAAEGNDVVFTVTREGNLDEDLTLTYTVNNNNSTPQVGDAQAGIDYERPANGTGTITLPAGETSASIMVSTIEDTVDETDAETFKVALTNISSNAKLLGSSRATGIIVDKPTLTVTGGQAVEGNEVVFTVTPSKYPLESYTVNYETSNNNATVMNGDADETTDYDSKEGTLTFSTSNHWDSLSQEIRVQTNIDTSSENSETFKLILSSTSANVKLAGQLMATGTILDRSTTPTLTVTGGSITTSSTTGPSFAVTLSHSGSQAITVPYTLRSTLSGTGFESSSGTLRFPANSNLTTKTVTTQWADIMDIPYLIGTAFTLTLTPPTNLVQTGGQHTATSTIVANPTLTIGSNPIRQYPDMTFTINLSQAINEEIRHAFAVSYSSHEIQNGVFGGYSVPRPYVDYNIIPAGVTSWPLTLFWTGNEYSSSTFYLLREGDNRLQRHWPLSSNFQVSNQRSATLTNPSYDYPSSRPSWQRPASSISPGWAVEGNEIAFRANLGYARDTDLTLSYATSTPTGNDAQPNSDYTPKSGTVMFPAGTTSKIIRIETLNDDAAESSETFTITFDGKTAIGTIIDKPTFTIANATAKEGNDVVFTITRSSGSANEEVSVSYATSDNNTTLQTGDAQGGDAMDKDANIDYIATTGTVLFPAGATTRTIRVKTRVNADTSNETFKVRLTSATPNAKLGTAKEATGTITENTKPTVTIAESDPTPTNVPSFAINLSKPPSENIEVSYKILSSASASNSHSTGTATIMANSGAAIPITRPSIAGTARAVEIYTLAINSGDAEVGNPASGTSIVNDKPTVSITGGQAYEGDQVIFTVALSQALASNITVKYEITGDITSITTPPMGDIEFSSGTVVKSFQVATREDTASTSNKTFTVTLSIPTTETNPLYSLSKHKSADGTILNQ